MAGASRQVTAEEKRKALELALRSSTFTRTELLKPFLRYVCEQEIAGKGGGISEYTIAVDVFHRAPEADSADDSTVRSRAHSLRRKLQDFYTQEMPEARVRIELPKGSYCPRFVAIDPPSPSPSPQSASAFLRAGRGALAIALGAALVAGLGAGYWLGRAGARGQPDPVLREAWGPLLEPSNEAILCVATPPSLYVRSSRRSAAPSNWRPLPASLGLPAWFSQRQSLRDDEELFFLATHNSPLWGEAAGAVVVARTLAQAGVRLSLIPERALEPFALRERNVFLFGRPEFSRSARILLGKAHFSMEYNESLGDQAVAFTDPKSGARAFLSSPPRYSVGLISVLPSEGTAANGRRSVVISGNNSAGAEAAAEYFSSPNELKALWQRFKREGYSCWPSSFQVVVTTQEEQILPLNLKYQTHHILAR